ncbi:MAG TPA: hypothetical protein VFG69_07375 [Nannocystaceae bacterium]|nr:hypothetical protein [Nannocystaceae bacterium]
MRTSRLSRLSRRRAGCGLALAVVAGCAEPPESTIAAWPAVKGALATYELAAESLPIRTATLAWQPPSPSCPHVYRLHAHYEPALLHEEDNSSTLALGRTPGSSDADGPPPLGETVALRLFYRGFRAETRGSAREVYVSAQEIGPSAPTAACTPRTWDPMEDALTLGWPRLPARMAAVDEHWPGLLVGGRCNRSACVDPKTGGGGEQQHERTCVTMAWDERLAGVYEIGGERLALVESHWSDGQMPIEEDGVQTKIAITADSVALVSLAHGRPVWARTTIDHPWPQMAADKRMAPIVRTWTLESIDACPGSLAALGWERPEAVVAEHDRAVRELANSDELRRREEASKRRSEGERDLFAPGAPPS